MSFQPRTGSRVFDSENRVVVLEGQIGKGGEGSVWSILSQPGVVAKFYHAGPSAERSNKLAAMCDLKSDKLLKIAAWPTSMLKAGPTSEPVGLLMPRVSGYQEAHLLYTPKNRRTNFPEAQFPFILHTALNTARAFATVHEAGQVIGDVNHGNLLISKDARVALIDCDSFEVSYRGQIYPCLVGVPQYTPPELQSRPFKGVRRTQQHDAFGLAVLIFHLLFLGRHPFAGIFRQGNADKTIEDAIREFRFAYSADRRATEMEPPPFIPPLTDLPADLVRLFVRAFERNGATGGRPFAAEWIDPLSKFIRSLKRCPANEAHHFFKELSACPWCWVEKAVKIPMFGIKLAIVKTPHFDLLAVWAEIEAIRPAEMTTSPVFANALKSHCTADPRIAAIKKERLKYRLLSIGSSAVAVALMVYGQLDAIAWTLVFCFGIALTAKFWRKEGEGAAGFGAELKTAETLFNSAMEHWNKLQMPPLEFTNTKQELERHRNEFADLSVTRMRRMDELKAMLIHKQRIHFLERFRIEDASIPNISAGRKALLLAYGVEDASDVRPSLYIKGFGPKLKRALLDWRNGVERLFVFDPRENLDPVDVQALDAELSKTKLKLSHALSSGPQRLHQILQNWEATKSTALQRVNSCSRALAQAQVNEEALR